ncbi:PIN domain-containing protein [bacterium]|nr:PIN domain-containing protein [bacterium]
MIDNYLIDTDIIIYWLNGSFPLINDKIDSIEDNCIFISSITVAELYFGAHNSSKIEDNLILVNELVSEINIVNFTVESGKQFGIIKADIRHRGRSLNDSDIFIAATAISNNLILVTNNEKHFQRIENLNLQNWVKFV